MPYKDPLKNKECIKKWNLKFGKATRRKRKLKQKIILDRIKLELGCEFCGYKQNPLALQFHHINKKNKSFSISKGLTFNLITLLKETQKCIVLCANCHIIEEYRLNDNSLY